LKVYAVRKGRKTGIFTSWEECQKQVVHFKGAEFKGFKTHLEASKYLDEFKNQEAAKDEIEFDLHIYVDGSYRSGITSYAVIVLDKDKVLIDTFQKSMVDTFGSHNVTGEILGAIIGIKYAYDRNMSVKIYHDYSGISNWYNGSWKANTEIAKFYLEEVKNYRQHDIYFEKVKGHTGDKYNELADRLAKRALDIIDDIKY
jgi:ribonuclease HI